MRVGPRVNEVIMGHRALRAGVRVVFVAAVTLTTGKPPLLRGQEAGPRPAPTAVKEAQAGPALIQQAEDAIKPLPLEPIPDNPPPHEGAMIRLVARVEPPDLILVEFLEAYPGRPITGERLVCPEGTISLGWYGDVHVAGLTPTQVKVKLIHHLRRYLTDEALGLLVYDERGGVDDANPRPLDSFPKTPYFDPQLPDLPRVPDRDRDQARADRAPERDPFDALRPAKPRGEPLKDEPKPGALPKNANANPPLRPPRPAPAPADVPAPPPDGPAVPAAPVAVLMPVQRVPDVPPGAGGKYVSVEPAKSSKVWVMISAYNHDVYYVLGDVGSPGRITCTGNETVLDALQFAGGLLPIADRKNVRLHRPARGGKPAQSYRIDLDAIERGDNKANLQIFPKDRLIIDRKGDPGPPIQ